MASNYSYHPIKAHELSTTDLIAEYDAHDTATNGPVEVYAIRFYDDAGFQRGDSAQALYFPKLGRLGIAWGADATWADVESVASGIKMWATDADAWEAAN
jgi:hypothetical protein